jgi:hypothetical protein
MATISKKSAKRLRARERHNAMHETSSHGDSTPTPPAQPPKFPDINVRQEAANYFRAYQRRLAPTLVVEPVSNKSPVPAPAPIPLQPSTSDKTVTTAVNWSDPETVTLEQIDKNTRRLLREWPKDDGIPFPMEMLEVLRDLKLKVRARDEQRVRTATPLAPVDVSPGVDRHNSPFPIIVDHTATASAPPNISFDAYTTAQPEQLYSLLTATAPTANDATADQPETITKPFGPADYSLEDIDEVLRKIGKRYRKHGVPVPESIRDNADTLRRAVQARDAAVPARTTTEPIINFESDTIAPAPTSPSAPASTAARTPIPAPIPAPVPIPTPALASTTTTDLSTTATTKVTTVATATSIGYHRDREELEAGKLEDRGKKEWEDPEEESAEREGNRGGE